MKPIVRELTAALEDFDERSDEDDEGVDFVEEAHEMTEIQEVSLVSCRPSATVIVMTHDHANPTLSSQKARLGIYRSRTLSRMRGTATATAGAWAAAWAAAAAARARDRRLAVTERVIGTRCLCRHR